jgi:hypothetical protein
MPTFRLGPHVQGETFPAPSTERTANRTVWPEGTERVADGEVRPDETTTDAAPSVD